MVTPRARAEFLGAKIQQTVFLSRGMAGQEKLWKELVILGEEFLTRNIGELI